MAIQTNVYKIIIQPYYVIVILSQNVIDGNQPTIHSCSLDYNTPRITRSLYMFRQ